MVGTRRMGGHGTGTGNTGNTGQTLGTNGVNCGMCNSSNLVLSDGIGCDHCTKWFHPTSMCTGLKINTIKVIQRDGGDGIRFVCSDCRCNTGNSSANDNVIATSSPIALGQLYEMVKSIAESVTSLTAQVATLANQISSSSQSSTSPSNFHRESLYAEMREFNERAKCKDSIIVRGSRAVNNDGLRAVLNNIGDVLLNSSIELDSIFCINREHSIYRVEIKSHDIRSRLLAESKKLKDTNLGHVFISRDLTYLQRQELRAKRMASHSVQTSDHVEGTVASSSGRGNNNLRGRAGMSSRGRGRASNVVGNNPNVLVSQGAGRGHQMPGQAVATVSTVVAEGPGPGANPGSGSQNF